MTGGCAHESLSRAWCRSLATWFRRADDSGLSWTGRSTSSVTGPVVLHAEVSKRFCLVGERLDELVRNGAHCPYADAAATLLNMAGIGDAH